MAGFNNNDRLQDHIMYALDWAIYLRHNLTDQLMPFLFEWEGEEIFKKVLQPHGDPEEFAYRIAGKSERNSDQFVVGYEGMLTDESGNKQEAFIIKGYDKTQLTGVFIAQLFTPKEKGGTFELVEKPILIGNPDLPIPLNEKITPNYTSEELYSSGMILDDNDYVAILSHHNPSVVASGVKNFMRSKLNGSEALKASGKLEISIAPQEFFGDFFKYTIKRVIEEELSSDYAKKWENANGKQISMVCTYDKGVEIFDNTTKINKDPKLDHQNDDDVLVNKYQDMNKAELDQAYFAVVSVPNASTNIDCLKKMSALITVYESKGIQMPGDEVKANVKQSKSGCIPIMIFGFLVIIISLC